MVWVLGGHADPQCVEDTLCGGEAECGRLHFLSHCHCLRGEEEREEGERVLVLTLRAGH